MPMCIAVIDDDSACRILFYHLLSEEGYTVYLLPDSATALQSLHALAPAAIILDLRLENPTAGWEVIRYVRHDPALSATPVLVCSADLRALEEGAANLKQLGAMTLAKPFDVDELLFLLQQLLCGVPPAPRAIRCAGRRGLDYAGS
jgi:DNA-binding response OmpR family regulator